MLEEISTLGVFFEQVSQYMALLQPLRAFVGYLFENFVAGT